MSGSRSDRRLEAWPEPPIEPGSTKDLSRLRRQDNPVVLATRERHHECKGAGVAHLLDTIRGGNPRMMALDTKTNGKNEEGEEQEWGTAETWKVASNI